VADTDAGDLVKAALGGDQSSWDELVRRYSGLVWSVTRGYRLGQADAADVFQTTWLRLAEHLGRIDKPGQVGAWLATTARHEALRIARGATRIVPAEEATLVALGQVDDYSPERAVLDAEQARLDSDRAGRLWRAFGELPGRCRELLRILIASPPPSYAEVAAAMDMPVGSIGPTRARCLRRLRKRLAGEVSDAGNVAHESERARQESDRAR
jgi:RNA polymerase sigma factor (sigma-70 family)